MSERPLVENYKDSRVGADHLEVAARFIRRGPPEGGERT